MRKQRKWIGMTLLTYAGLSLDLASHAEGSGWHQALINWIASLQVADWSRLWLVAGLYYMYQKSDQIRYHGRKWALILPAALFAVNMVLGFSFAKEGSWNLLLEVRNCQLLKTFFALLTWYIAAFHLLKCAFHFLGNGFIWKKPVSPLKTDLRGFHSVQFCIALLDRHPFLIPFLTLLVLFLPRIALSFPAVFMGDTPAMIFQAYPELHNPGLDYLTTDSLLQAGIYINQHHPPLYTVCLHGFLQLGTTFFHSLNAGVFLFCLAQALLTVCAFSFAVSTMVHAKVSPRFTMATIIYAVIHPQIGNCLMLVTKDISYSACFLFLLSCFFRMRAGAFHRKEMSVVFLSALGILLLRNEGKYVLLVSGLLMAVTDRNSRKPALVFTAAMMALSLIVYQGLYPRLGFTRGSIREMLSIPFQQTARTLRDHPEDVSAEERKNIGRILDTDLLPKKYNMGWADPVKELYREQATAQDRSAFFQTWFRILLRHPDTYVQATYGNYYQYFYPDKTRIYYESYASSDAIVQEVNKGLERLHIAFALPAWNASWKAINDSLWKGLSYLPFLGVLITPAFDTWWLLILVCWAAGKTGNEWKEGLALCWLPLLQLLVQFAGPTNGFYGRYLLPIACVLPFLTGFLLIRDEKKNETSPASSG